MSLKDLKDQNDTLKGAAWDYAATIERLRALLAEVGEPHEWTTRGGGAVRYCISCYEKATEALPDSNIEHKQDCPFGQIKAELAGGGA